MDERACRAYARKAIARSVHGNAFIESNYAGAFSAHVRLIINRIITLCFAFVQINQKPAVSRLINLFDTIWYQGKSKHFQNLAIDTIIQH